MKNLFIQNMSLVECIHFSIGYSCRYNENNDHFDFATDTF